MDFNLTTELQEHLDTNEKLIWTGQPKKGIVFRTADIFLIPFSLLWCGFAIFWFTTAISSGAPFFFAMFGIPFVVIGLIFVFGRFIIDAKQRENTFYGLTDDRIIIKSGVYKKTIKSLNIRTLSDIEYDEKNDGSGTINIGPKNPMMIWGNGMNWWPGIKAIPSLDLIQDVRQVYKKITEIQKAK
jgi:hypothetical protein